MTTTFHRTPDRDIRGYKAAHDAGWAVSWNDPSSHYTDWHTMDATMACIGRDFSWAGHYEYRIDDEYRLDGE